MQKDTKKDTCQDSQEIQRFIKGYESFKKRYFAPDEKNQLYKKLVEFGQTPKTLVVTCSDSRVNPSEMLGCKPGELFVVRNVANLVPPYEQDDQYHGTSAALEFAVLQLKVEHIILMGHSHCGGIESLFTNVTQRTPEIDKSFIATWMQIARNAQNYVLEHHKDAPLVEKTQVCEEQSLLISLKNLRTFPWINDRVEKKTLALHAWYFDMKLGVIKRYNPSSNKFEDLASE